MPSSKGITPPVHSPADRAPEPRDREVHRTEPVGGVPRRETRQGRIRAWTTWSLRDLGYDGAVFLWSIVAFTILVAGVSVTASLLVLVIGVFVWVGFAYIVRWTTWVDRRLAGWQRKERVRAVYRRPAARGFLPLLKTVSSDPQTWRDLAWLGLTSIAGFALGLAAITAAGIVLAYVSDADLVLGDLGSPRPIRSHQRRRPVHRGQHGRGLRRERDRARVRPACAAARARLRDRARRARRAHPEPGDRRRAARVEPRSISLARAGDHVGDGRRHAGDVRRPRRPLERRASQDAQCSAGSPSSSSPTRSAALVGTVTLRSDRIWATASRWRPTGCWPASSPPSARPSRC